jgi:hypothetical protein
LGHDRSYPWRLRLDELKVVEHKGPRFIDAASVRVETKFARRVNRKFEVVGEELHHRVDIALCQRVIDLSHGGDQGALQDLRRDVGVISLECCIHGVVQGR